IQSCRILRIPLLHTLSCLVHLEAPPSLDYVSGPKYPPSPEFIPEPVYPEFIPAEDDILPIEEQPLPAASSPIIESSGYINESDPDEDPEDDPEEDPEDDPGEDLADYPADRGVIDHAPSAEEIEPFKTDESAATPAPHLAYRVTARMSIRP
nr:hypothetical protein [Tanacetum cinerariifolium]